jgi:hypothetical protein
LQEPEGVKSRAPHLHDTLPPIQLPGIGGARAREDTREGGGGGGGCSPWIRFDSIEGARTMRRQQ